MKSLKIMLIVLVICSSYSIFGAEEGAPGGIKVKTDEELYYINYFKDLDFGSKQLLLEYIFYEHIGSSIQTKEETKKFFQLLSVPLEKHIKNSWQDGTKTFIAFQELQNLNREVRSLLYILAFEDLKELYKEKRINWDEPMCSFITPNNQEFFGKRLPDKMYFQ